MFLDVILIPLTILGTIASIIGIASWFGLKPYHVRDFTVSVVRERERQTIVLIGLVFVLTLIAISLFVYAFRRDGALEAIPVGLMTSFVLIMLWRNVLTRYPTIKAYLGTNFKLDLAVMLFALGCCIASWSIWGITSDESIFRIVMPPVITLVVGVVFSYFWVRWSEKRSK